MHGTRDAFIIIFVWLSCLWPALSLVRAEDKTDEVEKKQPASTEKMRVGAPQGANSEEGADYPVQFPSDREVEKILERAERALQEKADWIAPTLWLQSVLDRKEDVFVRVRHVEADGQETARWASGREEANRLLGTMPAAGLECYELQYGGRAQHQLDQAQSAGDMALLAEIGVRYLHTNAGGQANDLLGTWHLDRGRPLAATQCYLRLLDRTNLAPLTLYKAALAFRLTGDAEHRACAEKIWQRLADVCGGTGFTLDGKLASLMELRREFEQASLPPACSSSAILPLQELADQWQRSDLPAADQFDARYWVDKSLSQRRYRTDDLRLTAFYPLATAGKLVYRGFSGIDAVDATSGKLLWSMPLRAGLEALANDHDQHEAVQRWFDKYRQSATEDILFHNGLVGSLSSDGMHVYAVDDLPMPPHPECTGEKESCQGPEPPVAPTWAQHNLLTALAIQTGKVAWQLGAPEHDRTTLAGSHFLGPPLPIRGNLYVLTEKKSELRLACLEARHGEPLWTQSLAYVRTGLTLDVRRHLHPAQLTFGEGVLVCPTNAGGIVAIDPLSHTLLWGFRYGQPRPHSQPEVPAGDHLRTIKNDWALSAPIIADGKVVFVAPDDSRIFCLRLKDGVPLWVAERNDDVYVAGLFGQKILLVGKKFSRALRLQDGQQLWQLASGRPSGRGVAVGHCYHLPLEQGAVCTIDVEQGTVIGQSPLPRNEMPGNLLILSGRLVSRTETGLHCYATATR